MGLTLTARAIRKIAILAGIGALLCTSLAFTAWGQSASFPMSVAEQHRVADAVARLQRLNVLDDIWTARLNSAKELTPGDKDALAGIERQMVELLRESGDDLKFLSYVVSQNPAFFDKTVANTLEKARLGPENKYLLAIRLLKGGGAAKLMLKAMSQFNASEEIDSLNGKMEGIKAGRRVSGDLSRKAKCAIQVGASVGLWIGCGVGAVPACFAAIATTLQGMWMDCF